jgi:rod shape-determining protein MreC
MQQGLSRTARNAGLLVGLLTAFFVLASYQADRGRAVSAARGVVVGAVSPVQRIVSGVVGAVAGVWNGYFDLVGASSENERLRAERDALEQQVRSYRELRRENERLRGLLRVTGDVPAGWRVATIIGREPSQRYSALTLDQGSADGVRVDAPVIAPDGSLVGRIVEAGRWTSLVQLITDPLAGVGARLATSRATGLVSGTGGALLDLRYIDSLTEVYTGEEILTSGEDGIYPPGLLIGKVDSFTFGPPVPGTHSVPLTREQSALFLEITVRPAVMVDRLETVLVLDARAESEGS